MNRKAALDIMDAVDDINGHCPTCYQYLRTEATNTDSCLAQSVHEAARSMSDEIIQATLMARNRWLTPFATEQFRVDEAALDRALQAFHAEGPFAPGTEFERESMRAALYAARFPQTGYV